MKFWLHLNSNLGNEWYSVSVEHPRWRWQFQPEHANVLGAMGCRYTLWPTNTVSWRSYSVYLAQCQYLTPPPIRSNIQTLESSKRLSGVVAIINSTATPGSSSRPSSYSPESKCPNCEFGLYANDADQYTWNPNVKIKKKKSDLLNLSIRQLLNCYYFE